MSGATELRDVEALLEHVLPDPMGFVERLAEQIVERLIGQGLGGGAPTVVASDVTEAHEALADRNILLADALGACECWGEDPGCGVCGGEGAPGWLPPDPELFAHYVQPAIDRHPPGSPDGPARNDRIGHDGVGSEGPFPASAGDRPPEGDS